MAQKNAPVPAEEVRGMEVAMVDHEAMIAMADRVESLRNGGRGIFSSMPAATFDERMATAIALANAQPTDLHMDELIMLTHFVAQAVEVTDTASGTRVPATRIILVDADGKAYAGVSDGIFKSLENLVTIFGPPETWEQPIPVRVVRERSRTGWYFHTLKIGA